MDLTTKKGKVLKKIFGELNKKRWTCKQCEDLLMIIKHPELMRNGTKKGMVRKTARRAYENGRKGNTKAKRAMKMHHREGISLREAWRRV